MKVRVIIHDNDGGGYTAEVPAIPGCVTEGETRDTMPDVKQMPAPGRWRLWSWWRSRKST